MLLFDLAFRARFLSVFYTNDGVTPMTGRELLCVHSWAGSIAYEGALFILAAGAALCLLVGWFTRVAVPLCWFFLNSLQHRNTCLCDGGDSLLVLTLFWSMFLPLGARWSLDSRRRPPPSSPSTLNIAIAALLLQPVIMYFCAGMQKTGPEWADGSAVWFAVEQDWWAHPLAYALREHRTVCKILTFGTRLVEISAPILVFWPWGRHRLRFVGLALLITFQLGLAFTLQLWLIPVHTTLALLPFLPKGFWSVLQRRGPAWLEQRWEPSSRPSPSWIPHLALPFALYVGVFSLVSLMGGSLPGKVVSFGSALGLDETWEMYSPSPYLEEGRITFNTVSAAGEEMNPAQSLDPGRWRTLQDMTQDYRAKYYLESLLSEDRLLPLYAAWVCRSGAWNRPPIKTVRLRISKWPIGKRDQRQERLVEVACP